MTEGILGGFIGSILTVLISRICDLIQKRNEHKYSLKKSYFDRKLCVAEAAISHRYVLLSSLADYLAILTVMSENLQMIMAFPPEFMQKMLESANQKMARLSEPAFNAANAASLFFDMAEKLNVGAIKELMDLFVSIDASNRRLQFLASLFAQSKDAGDKQRISTTTTELIAKMQADIKKISDAYEKGYKEVFEVISHIRGEMKKYES